MFRVSSSCFSTSISLTGFAIDSTRLILQRKLYKFGVMVIFSMARVGLRPVSSK